MGLESSFDDACQALRQELRGSMADEAVGLDVRGLLDEFTAPDQANALYRIILEGPEDRHWLIDAEPRLKAVTAH